MDYKHIPQKAMTTRIICTDGLKWVGYYDARRSNSHRVYLKGHMHYVWRRKIQDMFVFKDEQWRRTMGEITVYDTYIESGGDKWPSKFFEIIYSDDI
jgi:hypothetical protein